MQGWIKLDRNILKWGWYTNGNTFRVFIHLLLTANIEDSEFDGKTIHRGQAVISYESIARTLKMTFSEVRTSFLHLKSTEEIAITRCSKYSVVTVVNYDKYQSYTNPSQSNSQTETQSLDNHFAITSQHNKNIRNKEYKNINNARTRTREKSSILKKVAAHVFNAREDVGYDQILTDVGSLITEDG